MSPLVQIAKAALLSFLSKTIGWGFTSGPDGCLLKDWRYYKFSYEHAPITPFTTGRRVTP
jgi:hypothetical protein